jgi:thiol:disulfide interchange protein DsbC
MKNLVSAAVAACMLVPSMLLADEATVREALEKRFSDARITSVKRMDVGPWYEVVVNGQNIVYTDESGRYGIFGNLVDFETNKSLTEARREELSFVDFARLPLEKAIVKVKGDGSRKVAVFSDPDCPYCKQLEQQLAFVTDVTVYLFLYPLSDLHPDAPRKATAIWCAPDRSKAWDDLMLYNRETAAAGADCKAPLEDIARTAKELNIEGTPGMVFANGRLVPGARAREELEQLLAQNGKS